MIEHLTGIILHKEDDHVVLDVVGVGYGLDVPAATADALGTVGEEAALWVYTHVSEDNLRLFGFAARGEREVFEVFMGISGLGPKIALAILSTFGIEELIGIVMRADAATLKSVPGIGLKKAEKLLIELKGRVERLSAGLEPERLAALGGAGGGKGGAFAAAAGSKNAQEAVLALEGLDMTPAVARRAVGRAVEILGDEAPVENLIREALRHRHAT